MAHLPPVLTDVQRLVFDHPVDVRLRVARGLAVQDGRVTLVNCCVLRLHLEANVHCMCTNRQRQELINNSLTPQLGPNRSFADSGD